ncbi:MAG: LAGLIDADG family homing endonuclease, partial [Parvibaculaceae bacterium]
TLFNCFVMGAIDDSMPGIFEGLKEAALTMQMGGGIGHDFSTLRPKGAPVQGVGADASGPLSFMDVWDAMCRTIMSAGSRRGAMMATLACDHPDIEAFIEAKRDPRRLRNFNLSVLVTDAFMAAVEEDADWPLVFAGKTYRTVKARELWERIMRATYEVAEPGVIFIDRINTENNLSYCETIHATNPCVPADTWVLTAEGPRQVGRLVGEPFHAVVDGRAHAASGFFATGVKPLLKLQMDQGQALRLTANHRLKKVVRRTRWRIETDWAEAGDLAPGDEIVLHDHRGLAGWGDPALATRDEDEGYLLGLLIGDGVLKTDKAVLSVWQPAAVANGGTPVGPDAVMARAEAAARALGSRADFAGWWPVAGRGEWRLATAGLKRLAEAHRMARGRKTITEPMECRSSAFHRGLLTGLFDTDGSIQGSQAKGVSVRLAQSDLALLQSAQRMLLRLGIASTLYRERRPAGIKRLPDGKGGTADYPVRAQHELVVSGDNLVVFAERVGFTDRTKSLRLAAALSGYARGLNRERFVARVASIEADGEEMVYDVSVPGVNAFDANGLQAHNCGEQPLPPYGACLLGSVNLASFILDPFSEHARLDETALAETVAVAVRFLDDVVDVSAYPLLEQEREAKAKRRIGLGVTGLADALALSGLRYGSEEAAARARDWMAAIERAAYEASIALSEEKGAFPLFDRDAYLASGHVSKLPQDIREKIARHGIRNALLTSIAPTGTISLFAGNLSSGVEPIFAYDYARKVLNPDGSRRSERVVDQAVALHRERFGAETKLPEHFVTAQELNPLAHLRMQAALQPHVDSSISKTINCPEDIPFEDFKAVYAEAYRLGLKGCTTYRPNAVTGSVLSVAEPPGEGARVASEAEGEAVLQSSLPLEAPPLPIPSQGEADVVYMKQPLERSPVLPGFTYKLKWGDSDHAIYITLNDIVQDGRRRPFEIFINSKNMEHYAWTVALTRMISAVFRRGGDVSFVVEELKAVFDPRGGQWMGGRYVPSLLAAIGGVIERHMIDTGFLKAADGRTLREMKQVAVVGGASPAQCPKCGEPSLVFQEGCATCLSCDYSKCE